MSVEPNVALLQPDPPPAATAGLRPGVRSDVRAAAALAGLHAQRADTERHLDPEVVEALSAAGFGTWLVPPERGGHGRSFADLTAAVALVGQECASAAWIASLLAYTGRFGGFLPLEGQAELWSGGPGTRVVSSLVSRDAAAPARPGGWQLSGTWTYTSGIEHSDWAFVAAQAAGTGDETQGRFFAVPRAAYRIEPTWHTAGMRATGSHALVLEDVFVPEHRSFPLDELFAGRPLISPEHRYALPLFAVNGLTFAGPVLGAARAALRHGGRNLAPGQGRRLAPGDAQRIAYARSAGEIDAAALLLDRIGAALDTGDVRPARVSQGTRDAALAVNLLTGAVNQLYRAGGTRAQTETDPLNRIWRDVNSAASHFVLQFEPAALAWTDQALATA